jgi:hypothetical protein
VIVTGRGRVAAAFASGLMALSCTSGTSGDGDVAGRWSEPEPGPAPAAPRPGRKDAWELAQR